MNVGIDNGAIGLAVVHGMVDVPIWKHDAVSSSDETASRIRARPCVILIGDWNQSVNGTVMRRGEMSATLNSTASSSLL